MKNPIRKRIVNRISWWTSKVPARPLSDAAFLLPRAVISSTAIESYTSKESGVTYNDAWVCFLSTLTSTGERAEVNVIYKMEDW